MFFLFKIDVLVRRDASGPHVQGGVWDASVWLNRILLRTMLTFGNSMWWVCATPDQVEQVPACGACVEPVTVWQVWGKVPVTRCSECVEARDCMWRARDCVWRNTYPQLPLVPHQRAGPPPQLLLWPPLQQVLSRSSALTACAHSRLSGTAASLFLVSLWWCVATHVFQYNSLQDFLRALSSNCQRISFYLNPCKVFPRSLLYSTTQIFEHNFLPGFHQFHFLTWQRRS
jgi:hypothetical protein